MIKEKGSSQLSAFISGYKASNIASEESSIKYHIEEIKGLLKPLLDSIDSIDSIDTGKTDLNRSLNKANNILVNADSDYLDKLIKFGEALKTTVLISKSRNDNVILDDPKIKRIVYHYLELAEKMEDSRINTLALTIGDSF